MLFGGADLVQVTFHNHFLLTERVLEKGGAGVGVLHILSVAVPNRPFSNCSHS